jgi:hypothetical protein
VGVKGIPVSLAKFFQGGARVRGVMARRQHH